MRGAYLEDYQTIKIIVPIDTVFNVNDVHVCEPVNINMQLITQNVIDSHYHLEYRVSCEIETNRDYYIYINKEISIHLDLGKIIRTLSFEKKNYTEEKLGFIYNKEYTEFRLWSPVAKEVILVLPNLKVEYHLNYYKKGIWKFRVYGDLEKEPYYYMVRVNEEFKKCLDPYGISSNANSEHNYVIDMNETYKQIYDRPKFSGFINDSIILEMHLKDFGYMLPGNQSYYKKAFENYNNIGIDYVKQLGVTHVQILPLNAFAGIDENEPDKYYNWGYNPVEYFSMTNWYSSDPNDPYATINELKELVDNYHKEGLLVNLDVVFNHVFNHKTFSLNTLVPGYVFRTDYIDFMTNGSGCGNDLSTEHLMVRRLIVDAIVYYTKTFGFDGYRFDLMGLIDIDTMKEIESKLNDLNPNIILYGEGWEMSTGLEKSKLAFNKDKLPNVAYFNDGFRNIVKGNPFNLEKGLVSGSKIKYNDLKHIISGSNSPSQSLNFIECHDNYTLFDQMSLTLPKLDPDKKCDFLKLGLQLLFVSQGIPFIHLGMEFGRTKNNHDNSYNLPIEINKVDWSKINEYEDVINSLKDIIKLRKAISLFRLSNSEDISKHLLIDEENDKYFSFNLFDSQSNYKVIICNDYEENLLDISGNLIYDGRLCDQCIKSYSINKPGVYVIKTK